ncbi:MAG: hypothetical protein HYZ18_04260 [Pseudogulbenkiania sp.]|nr:hypothetical protein [Pseudogulbenkiania sp.]
MTMPRGRPPGCIKSEGSGRKPGLKDRVQVTSEMRRDILLVYKKLGGTRFLVEWAKTSPDLFVRDVLSRVLPPIPREEPAVAVQVSTQVGQISDTEAAMRIAFALNMGAREAGLVEPPVTSTHVIEPVPEPVEPVLPPSTEPLPENNPPIGEIYRGSALEQGRERPEKRSRTKKGLL